MRGYEAEMGAETGAETGAELETGGEDYSEYAPTGAPPP